MARMSKEFPLVLLGAGVLTAGYFLYPEPDLEAKEVAHMNQEAGIVAENNAAPGNNGNGHSTARHSSFIWIHSFGYGGMGGGGRSALSSAGGSVSRGGFGGMGHASAGS